MSELNSQNKIHLLPEHIIDQIKAGEVIERPSTLLKEILENSIDAKSTQIDIHIIGNGLDLISLTDNGVGIDSHELPLAFCRHATSKIDRFEDIYSLHSYGFRGEALASIASISKVTCETQTKNQYGLIKIEGGQTITHQTESLHTPDSGTKLYIRDLFFNTPVRMKFIQSKTSEKNQLKKILNSFLLLNPETAFSIKWDEEDKKFFQTHPLKDQEKRIQEVIGAKQDLHFYINENIYDGVHFEIYLSKESNRGNAHKNHYLFINNRYVQDIQLHKIILNSASNLWPEGETGHYVAFINVPSDEIDVNIHPNKTVVKLFRAPRVYSVVSSTIKQIESKYSLKELRVDQSPYTEQSLNLNSPQTDQTVDYKVHDFKSGDNLHSYFDELHSPSTDSETHRAQDQKPFVKNFKEFDLIEIDNQLYILNKKSLIKQHLDYLFSQNNEKVETVPLMVSRPILIDHRFSINRLQLFESYGFELDQLDPKTILLRSFPKEFQHYPYLSMLEENLNLTESNDTADNLSFDFLDNYEFTRDFLFQTIKLFGKIKLLELGILKVLSEHDIKRIYERK
jgi:DNA mismatch repair protein MutL